MRHITSQGTAPNGLVWRKSSYSGHQTDCIQVADFHPDLVPVRDSKNPHGPALIFTSAAWTTFIAAIMSRDLQPPADSGLSASWA